MTTLATFLRTDSILDMENHTLPFPDHDHDHDHHSEHIEPEADAALIMAKIIAMAVLGIVSFILGIVPVKLSSWLRFKDSSKLTINESTTGNKHNGHHHHSHHQHGHNQQQPQPALISLLLCYGGGVLLYTTFLHLQPEVRESASKLMDDGKVPEWFLGTGLSLSDIVFCFGFFFVYFVEESVHWLLDQNSHEEEEDEEAALHRTMSLRRCNKSHYRDFHTSPTKGIIPRASLSAPTTNGHHMSKNDSNYDSSTVSGNVSVTASTQGLLLRDQISIIDTKSTDHSPLDPQLRMFGGPLAEEPMKGFKGGVDDELSKNSRVMVKSFRGLLTVLALSFHAVFEGFTVGLEKSFNGVWYMFAAIATHKFVIAFCVGIGLVSSRTRLPLIVVYVATFAMVTPLGIGIGIALSDNGGASQDSLLSVVLQGMAAGTLLYVIFFEVLQRERSSSNQSGALQLAAILAGFCTMLLLQLGLGHSHHHGGEEHDHDHSHSHHH